MKKYLSMLLAAMLCVCGLALTACGGSGGNSGGGAAQEESAPAPDPTEKFIGDWKLAGAQTQGLTMVGDFSEGIFGVDMDIALKVEEGGTGTLTFNGEDGKFTWELKDDDTLNVTALENDDADDESDDADDVDAEGLFGGEDKSFQISFVDDSLRITTDDEDMDVTMIFTADGKMAGMEEIDTSAATDITNQADLVGEWKLTGMKMTGISVYGDADDLAALAGTDDADYSMTFAEDGSATLMGGDAQYTVGEDGASIGSEGVQIPLKMLDGKLVFDMSEFLSGFDIVMVFSK